MEKVVLFPYSTALTIVASCHEHKEVSSCPQMSQTQWQILMRYCSMNQLQGRRKNFQYRQRQLEGLLNLHVYLTHIIWYTQTHTNSLFIIIYTHTQKTYMTVRLT